MATSDCSKSYLLLDPLLKKILISNPNYACVKQYLLNSLSTMEVHELWKDLPAILKQDDELKMKLPCYEHYMMIPEDQWDGPPVSKSFCWHCIKCPRCANKF